MVLVSDKPMNSIVLPGLIVMAMPFLQTGRKRHPLPGTEEPLRHEATQEMRDGPSQSACRRRLQTTSSGCARTSLGVSVEEKASMRCQVWITQVSDERTNGRVETVLLMVSNGSRGSAPRSAEGGPAYGLGGTRRIVGTSVVWAFVWNVWWWQAENGQFSRKKMNSFATV